MMNWEYLIIIIMLGLTFFIGKWFGEAQVHAKMLRPGAWFELRKPIVTREGDVLAAGCQGIIIGVYENSESYSIWLARPWVDGKVTSQFHAGIKNSSAVELYSILSISSDLVIPTLDSWLGYSKAANNAFGLSLHDELNTNIRAMRGTIIPRA